MSSSTTYYALPVSTHSLSRGLTLVLDRRNNRVCELDSIASRVLSCCDGMKTPDAHATAAWQAGTTGDPSAMRRALEQLVELGLLRRAAATVGGAGAPAASACPAPISTVAVITADRPQAVERCLHSVIRHAATFGHTPRVVVVDGSRVLPDATAVAVDRVGKATGVMVHYVGRSEAGVLRHKLARHAPQSVLRFGLTPGSIGNNRNLASLFTVGTHVMMVDDDVLCEPWALEGHDDAVAFGGHVDTREWRFFPTRGAALSAATRVDADLLSAHGRLLGRSLDDIISSSGAQMDLGEACTHLLCAIADRGESRVRVTLTGIAGDSARYCAHRLLLCPGTIREILMSDRTAFESALTSREVHHIARRTIVTHDSTCVTYCLGLENDHITPPFMPVGRSEDTVFGAMLGFSDPAALFAHLPYGIVHDSDRPSAYQSNDRLLSARQTRVSEFLVAMMAVISPSTFSTSAADRLKHLGRAFMDIGKQDTREFANLVRETALILRCRPLAQLDSAMATDSQWPHHWRAAIGEYAEAFRAHAATPEFFVPIEFRQESSVDSAFRRMQTFVRDFGELILSWPEIWQAAGQITGEWRAD